MIYDKKNPGVIPGFSQVTFTPGLPCEILLRGKSFAFISQGVPRGYSYFDPFRVLQFRKFNPPSRSLRTSPDVVGFRLR